ncbi:MAG: hypothetical protein RBR68_11835 [Tenuifilaceae bacterium]|nr:hypothetical protein [Tenuifilaceae bacterium]
MNKNKIITSTQFNSKYSEVLNKLELSHISLSNLISRSNVYYSESSVKEDIILGKFLSSYNQLKAITGEFKNSSTIYETFTSLDNTDIEFHVDNRLNNDTQNGELTLGIKNTANLNIVSIIIEDESNGDMGSSIGTQKYDNINVITSNVSSSLFIYEKIANTFSASPLHLSLTLKTEKLDIMNGIYIRMYTENSVPYPKIDLLSISEDGEIWSDIEIKSFNINKSDYYIRFLPIKARYIRLKFTQNMYGIINTTFGLRYRYIVGIREITAKQTEYNISGQYISIPYTSKSDIKSILMQKTDKSNNDINYFISGNNGSKWLPIEHNKELKLNNDILGLRDGADIKSIRVKIDMNKSDIALRLNSTSDILNISSSNKYTLSNKPIELKTYIGNHISYGPSTPYTINVFEQSDASSSITSENTRQYTLQYVPYYDDMINDITILYNGVKVGSASYRFMQDIYPENSILKFLSKDIGNGTLSVYFNPVVYDLAEDKTITNIFKLPQPAFVTDPANILVVSQDNDGNYIYVVDNSFYSLISDTELYIDPSQINTDYTYLVSYYPATKIETYTQVENNIVTLNGIRQSTEKALIKFDYTYKAYDNASVMNYYTPICNEYTLELI